MEENIYLFLNYSNQKMEVLYITIGVSIIVALIFFLAFIKSVRSGQYDDTYTPSVRMLFDDELIIIKKKDEKESKSIKNN
jgi:cbb3-type cytochrome oxidase maturation protein